MFSSSIALALLGALAAATPVQERQTATPSNFYLVTTSSSAQSSNTSALPDVGGIQFYEYYHESTFYLSSTDYYYKLPQFNLTDGTLHTLVNPLGNDPIVVNSTVLRAPEPLTFEPYAVEAGKLALQDGYLLTVDGDAENWTICTSTFDGDFKLLTWRGGEGCTKTYIQAVSTPLSPN